MATTTQNRQEMIDRYVEASARANLFEAMNEVIDRRFGILPGDLSDLTDLEVDAWFELWNTDADGDVIETPESLAAYGRAHHRRLEIAAFLMAPSAALHEELASLSPKER
jgi:hypothetical protein